MTTNAFDFEPWEALPPDYKVREYKKRVDIVFQLHTENTPTQLKIFAGPLIEVYEGDELELTEIAQSWPWVSLEDRKRLQIR